MAKRAAALIIVDYQNDFIDGSLAIGMGSAKHNPLHCLQPINRLIDDAPLDKIVYSMDWHPQDHVSFVTNVHMYRLDATSPAPDLFVTVTLEHAPFKQVLYPPHCVQGTPGAELHPSLHVISGEKAIFIKKGVESTVEQYSAFTDTTGTVHTDLEVTTSLGTFARLDES